MSINAKIKRVDSVAIELNLDDGIDYHENILEQGMLLNLSRSKIALAVKKASEVRKGIYSIDDLILITNGDVLGVYFLSKDEAQFLQSYRNDVEAGTQFDTPAHMKQAIEEYLLGLC